MGFGDVDDGPDRDRKASPHALDEYKDLRAEILQSQQTRILILGFAFTLIGAFAAVSLGRDGRPPATDTVAGLASLGGLLLAAAVHLTTVLTQRIDRLSEYIRRHLEEPLRFGWENDWTDYREKMRNYLQRSERPLGTSKPLALFYAVLAAADGVVFIMSAEGPCVGAVFAVTGAVALSLYLSANLYWRFGWHLGWTPLYGVPRRRWPKLGRRR